MTGGFAVSAQTEGAGFVLIGVAAGGVLIDALRTGVAVFCAGWAGAVGGVGGFNDAIAVYAWR
jgi:hypothetical protein